MIGEPSGDSSHHRRRGPPHRIDEAQPPPQIPGSRVNERHLHEPPLPHAPQGAAAAYQDFRDWVMPWQMGNTHPRFWGWYMGNGTAFGALGDFLAATVNPNMGGGNHVGNLVESQVLDWCKEIVGLPLTSSGLMACPQSWAMA